MKAERPLTQGSIYRTLISVALPAIGYMSLETLLSYIDTYWVSRLGVDAVSAVSIGIYLVWLYFSMIEIVATGVVTYVAQEAGAEREEGVDQVVFTGIYSALGFSFILAILGILFIDDYLRLFSISARTQMWVRDYLLIFLVTFPLSAIYYVAVSVYEGLGNTRIPFWSSFIVLLLNSLLDPFFIFLLKLEVLGAALASAVAKLVATIYLWSKLRGATSKRKFNLSLLPRMIGVGFPSSLYWLVSVAIFMLLNSIASRIDTDAVAAMGVGVRFESFTYIIATGLATAASSFVGQNIGAHSFGRAEKGAKTTLLLGFLSASFIGTVFYVLSDFLSGIFLERRALAIGSLYLKINAFSQPLFALSIVFEGIFIGMGRTLLPLFSAVIITLLRVPFAHFFSKFYGVKGIFITFPLTNFIMVIILWIFFLKGRRMSSPSADHISKER